MGVVDTTKFKTKLACVLEADESKRLRVGESLPNHHRKVSHRRGMTKVRRKKQVINEARASGATVRFASSMDMCHNGELVQTFGSVQHDMV